MKSKKCLVNANHSSDRTSRKKVKRLLVEEASTIHKEWSSCLVDRETSKIAFISSVEGGMI